MTTTTLSSASHPLGAYSAPRTEPARSSPSFKERAQEVARRWGLSQTEAGAPGLVGPKVVEQAPKATGGLATRLRCAETGRWHETVPDAVRADIDDCNALITMARNHEYDKWYDHGPKDAFALDVNGDPYYEGFSEARSLLPESLRTDPRLNLGLNTEDNPAGTLRCDKGANTLFDPKTGFAAAIGQRQVTGAAQDATREVIIAFGPLSSQGGWLAQGVRCAMNLLGFKPPDSFKQAAELAGHVKAHFDKVNSELPAGAPKFKLRLTGHSMGGALATYAAAKNPGLDALVFNPMRLGALTRADVGKEALKALPKNVTEVVVKTDWLSDNWLAAGLRLTGRNRVGALGTRYLVPAPGRAQVRAHYMARDGFSERDLHTERPTIRATFKRLMDKLSANKDSAPTVNSAARKIKRLVDNFSVHNDFAVAVKIHRPEVSPKSSLADPVASDPPDLEPSEEPSVVRRDSVSEASTISTFSTSDEFSEVDDGIEPTVVRITHLGDGFIGPDARRVVE